MAFRGAKREKSSSEGPLGSWYFYRIFLGIVVIRFSLSFYVKAAIAFIWEKFPAFSKELGVSLILLLFFWIISLFCGTFWVFWSMYYSRVLPLFCLVGNSLLFKLRILTQWLRIRGSHFERVPNSNSLVISYHYIPTQRNSGTPWWLISSTTQQQYQVGDRERDSLQIKRHFTTPC